MSIVMSMILDEVVMEKHMRTNCRKLRMNMGEAGRLHNYDVRNKLAWRSAVSTSAISSYE